LLALQQHQAELRASDLKIVASWIERRNEVTKFNSQEAAEAA